MSKLVADYMHEGIEKTSKKVRSFYTPVKDDQEVKKACAIGAVGIGLTGTCQYSMLKGLSSGYIKRELPFLVVRLSRFPEHMIPSLDSRKMKNANSPSAQIAHLVYDLNDHFGWCRKDIAHLLKELEEYYNENLK